MDFRLSAEQLGEDGHLIAFIGEADPNSAPALKRELLQAIESGARHVVVDLTETTFIDSTTLGILIGASKRLRSRGGDVSLVCGDGDIRKIFEITLLDRIFTIDATRDEALDRLGLAAGAA